MDATALAFGDFNGDGVEDLARGYGNDGRGGHVDVSYGNNARSGQTYTQNTRGIDGSSERYDQFGATLAVGDFNRDGYDDLAVGVPGEDISGIRNAGMVNVIYGSRSGLTRTDQAIHQNTSGIAGANEVDDYFAKSLAAGDFNGDGYDDLAIGVPGEDIGSIRDAGAVNVLYGSRNKLTGNNDQLFHENASGIAGTSERYDRYGSSLTVGDFNADGRDDLAIGIPGEDVGSITNAGAVNVIFGSRNRLTASGDRWIHQNSSGILDVAEKYDNFGTSLAAGDFDNDGHDDLAIGVPYEDIGRIRDAGAVNVLYGYSRGISSRDQFFQQNTRYIEGVAERSDWFGQTVTTGDFNGDGRDDLAVGVPGEDIGSVVNAGGVNMIFGARSGLTTSRDKWISQASTVAGSVTKNAYFGKTLASGQMKGGYREELAVGTKLADKTTSGSTIVAGTLTLERLNQIRSYSVISFDPSSSVKKMARYNPNVPIASITLNL